MEVTTTFIFNGFVISYWMYFVVRDRKKNEKKSQRPFLRRRRDLFRETSSRPLPGDALGTSKTSSRLFLLKAKHHLETIHGFSVYIRFNLLTYYHTTPSLDRQTN